MKRQEWIPVLAWELQRVLKRKDFVIATLLMPVLILAIGVGVSWIRKRQQDQKHRIAVVTVDSLGAPARAAGAALPALTGFVWTTPSGGEAGREALVRAVEERKLEGAVLLPADYAGRAQAEIIVRRANPGWKRRLEDHLLAQARLQRAASHGLDSTALAVLDRRVVLEEKVVGAQATTTRGNRVVAVLAVMLIMVTIFVTGSYLGIGITGEKQARVTEVIVSAIRPQSWIDGKIAGYVVIALIQALVWLGSLLVMAALFIRTAPPRVDLGLIAGLGLFFLLGLVFYVALYAVILATIKDMMSTQKIQAYLFFLPMIPFAFLEPAIDNPDAPWVIALSLMPMFSPMLMPMRMAIAEARSWEIAVALLVLAGSAWLMRLAAGHAFRIGMLMYGKELTLPELWRWSRER
jgi:ABC-2 type transport system permease protein